MFALNNFEINFKNEILKKGSLMKYAIITLSLLAGLASHANDPKSKIETFKCNFTEPFISVSYSSKTKTMTVHHIDNPEATIVNDLKVKRSHAGLKEKLDIVDDTGVTYLSMTKEQGSDGMSDIIFPYSGEFSGIIGGCESNTLKRINPNYKN